MKHVPTGDLYAGLKEAMDAGCEARDLVELKGEEDAIKCMAERVKAGIEVDEHPVRAVLSRLVPKRRRMKVNGFRERRPRKGER